MAEIQKVPSLFSEDVKELEQIFKDITKPSVPDMMPGKKKRSWFSKK